MKKYIVPLDIFVVVLFLALSAPVGGMDELSVRTDDSLEGLSGSGDVLKFSRAIAEAYNNRAIVWVRKEEYDKAIKDFTRALEMAPRYAEAYNNRGIAWFYKGYNDRAIADYTKALELDPEYEKAYHNRGIAWFYKGDLDRAIDDYTRALEINPRYAEAFYNRGMALTLKGDYKGAIDDCKKATEFEKDCAQAYNQLAWLLSVCPADGYRDGAMALEMAEKAVRLRPDDPSYLDSLGAAYAEVGEFDRAAETQKSVIAMLEKRRTGKEGLEEYRKRLEAYREGRPWRIGEEEAERHHNSKSSPEGRNEDGKGGPGILDGSAEPKHREVSGGLALPGKEGYSVQVGAFLALENAQKMESTLKEKDYDVWVAKKSDSKGRVWYRVLVGWYRREEAAEKAAADFSAKEKMRAIVRHRGDY